MGLMTQEKEDVLILKKPQVSSYWIDKTPVEPDSFRHQF
jgi:hypothetical protein